MMRKKLVKQHLLLKQRLKILMCDIENVKKLIELRNNYNVLLEKCMSLKI